MTQSEILWRVAIAVGAELDDPTIARAAARLDVLAATCVAPECDTYSGLAGALRTYGSTRKLGT